MLSPSSTTPPAHITRPWDPYTSEMPWMLGPNGLNQCLSRWIRARHNRRRGTERVRAPFWRDRIAPLASAPLADLSLAHRILAASALAITAATSTVPVSGGIGRLRPRASTGCSACRTGHDVAGAVDVLRKLRRSATLWGVTIYSAEEFVALRSSQDPAEYNRAAHEQADLDAWQTVIRDYPDMRFRVAQNKTVPVSILTVLAMDQDPRVRSRPGAAGQGRGGQNSGQVATGAEVPFSIRTPVSSAEPDRSVGGYAKAWPGAPGTPGREGGQSRRSSPPTEGARVLLALKHADGSQSLSSARRSPIICRLPALSTSPAWRADLCQSGQFVELLACGIAWGADRHHALAGNSRDGRFGVELGSAATWYG